MAKEAFDAETLLNRYRVRGKAEKTFGERKTGLNPQLSSSARPRSHFRGRPIERETEPAAEKWRPQNEAVLLLNLLDFQWMHEGRCDMKRAEDRGRSYREVPRAGAPRALQGRDPRPEDDLPYRSVRRRLLVEAARNRETIHPPDCVAIARPHQRPRSSMTDPSWQRRASGPCCANTSNSRPATFDRVEAAPIEHRQLPRNQGSSHIKLLAWILSRQNQHSNKNSSLSHGLANCAG